MIAPARAPAAHPAARSRARSPLPVHLVLPARTLSGRPHSPPDSRAHRSTSHAHGISGYLRTVNNRAGRPFEEKTITAYSDPGKSLDRWLTVNGMDGDFTSVDMPPCSTGTSGGTTWSMARAARTRSSGTSSSCLGGSVVHSDQSV